MSAVWLYFIETRQLSYIYAWTEAVCWLRQHVTPPRDS